MERMSRARERQERLMLFVPCHPERKRRIYHKDSSTTLQNDDVIVRQIPRLEFPKVFDKSLVLL